MQSRPHLILALVFVAVAAALLTRVSEAQAQPFVVHEWGTFTSIAGADGVALDWRPLSGPSDLPKFVYRLDGYTPDTTPQASAQLGAPFHGVRGNFTHIDGKEAITGNVRMETPVIYFYTPTELEVSVAVSFPKGTITEWYPSVQELTPQRLNWGRFKVLPNATAKLPNDKVQSHYYPARNTDAATVQICRPSLEGKTDDPKKLRYEHERFLFYRGVGSFPQPLAVTLDNDTLTLTPRAGAGALQGAVVVFDRLNGQPTFTIAHLGDAPVQLKRPSAPGAPHDPDGIKNLGTQLRKLLVASGLYEKEAQAMVDTWRDHWFEEGLRVFYLLPTAATEALLPLEITPRPSELVRTLVGRLDVVTPEQREQLKATLLHIQKLPPAERDVHLNALRTRHGRFLPVVAKLVLDELKGGTLDKQIMTAVTTP